MSLPFVLLVEDDNNDETLAKLALEENSIETELFVVRSGIEALDFMFARGKYSNRVILDLPQVILLDLKLPKISGLEVLKELRKNELTKFVPIVVFTSSKEEKDLMEAYQCGANAFVYKPINFSDYSSAIQQMGLFWTLLNKTPQLQDWG